MTGLPPSRISRKQGNRQVIKEILNESRPQEYYRLLSVVLGRWGTSDILNIDHDPVVISSEARVGTERSDHDVYHQVWEC